MANSIQDKRRADKLKDWVATAAVAAVLALAFALALALLVEALAVAIGLAIGAVHWHRAWVDGRLGKGFEWLQGVPLLGAIAAPLVQLHQWLPARGWARDLMAWSITVAGPCWLAAKRVGPVLIARFDDKALRAVVAHEVGLRWAGPLGPTQQAAWDALQAGCLRGTGTGATPLLRPWIEPDITERLSLRVLWGANGVGKTCLSEALARQLDGSVRLDALPGRWAQRAWRLRIKLAECRWWRRRKPEDVWDCGYADADPAALAALARFKPRRPTLVIADELPAPALQQLVGALCAIRADFRHPVRVLVIDAALPDALRLTWQAATRDWRAGLHELGAVEVIDMSAVNPQ